MMKRGSSKRISRSLSGDQENRCSKQIDHLKRENELLHRRLKVAENATKNLLEDNRILHDYVTRVNSACTLLQIDRQDNSAHDAQKYHEAFRRRLDRFKAKLLSLLEFEKSTQLNVADDYVERVTWSILDGIDPELEYESSEDRVKMVQLMEAYLNANKSH